MADRALREHYPISDAVREKMVRMCEATLNDPKATPRDVDRAIRTLATLDHVNAEQEKAGRTETNVQIPITPEQLAAMSDEELAELDKRLDKLAGH